jgi:hypothetical protein
LDKYLQGLWTAKEKYIVLLRLNVVHDDDSLVSDERIREILAPQNGLLWDGSETDEANVIVARDYLPQRDMMQRFADRMVMISHGGVGGVSDGIAMAVPVIVLPGTPEQLDNGVAIDEVGLGCTLPTLAAEMLRDGGMKANGAHYNTEKAISVVRSSEFLKNLRSQDHQVEDLPTLSEAIAFWATQRATGVFAKTREALKTRMQKTALGASETAKAFWKALEVGFAGRQSAPAGEQASGASQSPPAVTRRQSRRETLRKSRRNSSNSAHPSNRRQSAFLWGGVCLFVLASICALQVVRRNKKQEFSADDSHVLPA